MSRIIDPGFDPRIADWLEADPDRAPADLMRTVESALPSIPQRRVTHLPWRFPPMSTFAKLAVAAVAVIAIGSVGIVALQPRGVPDIGSAPTASPSPTPTPAPSTPPPLSEEFTSPSNGISIAYPAGWSTRPATEPWSGGGWPRFEESSGDYLFDRVLDDHLFVVLASQPLDGKEGANWAAGTLTAVDGCGATEPVTIDGASGLVGVDCNGAAVAIDGRGYLILLRTSEDDPWLNEAYDRAWFGELLATIDLRPEDAVDAAPSPS